MGLACQKCFSCWSRKHEPEPGELSDAEMTALLRKVINEDNSQKLLSIFNDSLINPNTPLPVTLQSQVDHKKLLCLLWTPLMLATYAQKLHVLRVRCVRMCVFVCARQLARCRSLTRGALCDVCAGAA